MKNLFFYPLLLLAVINAYCQSESDYKMINLTKSSDHAEPSIESIAEIDKAIPETEKKALNTYALIVGNENYTKYQTNLSVESDVDYAVNDALVFSKYCKKTLGIPEDNIKVLTNATNSEMRKSIQWLQSRAEYGGEDIELIFYYSGHGFPDPDTKEKYIMPVDVNAVNVKEGIRVAGLYKDLTEYTSKKVTVFLDACFSGGGRESGLLAAKAVKIKPKENAIVDGKLVVFSSSSEEQESLFYKEKRHGIFTYYLLKKLQESKGDITYKALKDYLHQNVGMKAIDLYYQKQEPEVNYSEAVKNEWENWKLTE